MLLHHVLKPQFVWSTKICSVKWNVVYGSALPGLEDIDRER